MRIVTRFILWHSPANCSGERAYPAETNSKQFYCFNNFQIILLPKFMLLATLRTSEFAFVALIFRRKTFCQAANSPTQSGQVKF